MKTNDGLVFSVTSTNRTENRPLWSTLLPESSQVYLRDKLNENQVQLKLYSVATIEWGAKLPMALAKQISKIERSVNTTVDLRTEQAASL